MTTTDTTTSSTPDINQIAAQEYPARELGNFTGLRQPFFQAVFQQSVLDQIHLHGQSSVDIEVCGVLIGDVYQDSKGSYLLIDQCIRGSGATAQSTNVTFTAEVWQHIQETLDRDHPDRKIVGWYHTHPGFGIFLSDMDVFICDHFFNLPWQVAFVYDPKSGEEGNFVWRQGKPARESIVTAIDVTPSAARIPLISKTEAMAGDPVERVESVESVQAFETLEPYRPVKFRDKNSELIGELLFRVRRLERRMQLMVIALVFLTAFIAFWALGTYPGPQQQMLRMPTPIPTTQPMYRPTGVKP